MKRFVSIVLTVFMIVSMFTTVSADIGGSTSGIANPLQILLGVETLARKSGTSDEYTAALALGTDVEYESVGIDYRTTLNMESVRALFDRNFIKTVIPANSDLNTEFNNGKVNTTVTVVIKYSDDATISGDLNTAGDLDAGTIFSQVSRNVNTAERTVTITYKNTQDLLVSEISANKDTYLKDITFTLDDVVSYNKYKNCFVNVSLSGSTEIAFSSKTQTINYTGSASHVVSASHMLEVIPAKPATCSEKGWTEGVKCKTHNSFACGANGVVAPVEITDLLAHSYVHVDKVEPTCYSTGVKEHYMCAICRKDFSDQNGTVMADSTIAKLAHNWETVSGHAAGCLTTGLTDGEKCKVCGVVNPLVRQTLIPATGHSEVSIPAVPATCETAGKTEGSKCSVCDAIIVEPKGVAALGHSWGEWDVTLAPTEDAVGSKTRTCLNDSNHKETVEIPKLQHTCVADINATVITKAPTCTETGLQQKYCGCGKPVGDAETIPALGHSATQTVAVDIPATCTTEGTVAHWSCSRCGGMFLDAACTKKITSAKIAIDLNNHGASEVDLAAIAPTCSSEGLTAGKKCSACKVITVPQMVVPKLELETIDAVAATCITKGMVAHKHCANCNKDYTLDGLKEITAVDYEIPALGHSFNYVGMTVITEPTEDAEGEGRVNCERCEHFKLVPIAKLQHTHNEECEKIITPATCTTTGLKRIVYTCCNEIKEDNIVIPKTNHLHKMEIPAVASTCFKTGVKAHWFCSDCGKFFKDSACTQEIANINQWKKTDATQGGGMTEKTLHNYEVFSHGHSQFDCKKCSVCNDVVHVKHNDKAKVNGHGGIKEEKDKVKEERNNEAAKVEETKTKVVIDSNINLDDKEISAKLETKIHENDTDSKKASEEKVVLDIVVEKVTKYVDKDAETTIIDEEKELVTETEDLIEIEITIPSSMRTFVDFMVHRLHGTEVHEIKTTPNADGEYIVIAADKSKVTLYVKKFSEYALVGYDTVVNQTPIVNTGGGGGGSKTATVKFNTNGGSAMDSIKVDRNGFITDIQNPTRDGYVFEGWYTDYALTKPFDPKTMPVTSSMTLYAKWAESGSAGDCPGTAEGGCPCYNFGDLDAKEWYHEGVDYVLNNKMMLGLEEGVFGPDESLTRGMLVTVLYRKEGEPATNRSIPFADVDMSEYYANAVSWAQQNGIVNGVSDTHFAPNDNITREQIAAIMFRYAQFKGMNAVTLEENLHFADSNEISEYAVSAMNWAVGSGLIKGRTETTLNPTANTTRAEIAVILYRYFETIAK